MKANRHPLIGIWNVVSFEFNFAGEWRPDYCPESNEWLVCFALTGRYCEIIRNPLEETTGEWSMDNSGILSIRHEPMDAVTKCVFREEGRGTFLYFYDDARHIAPDPMLIVRYHANMRYKLVRVGK